MASSPSKRLEPFIVPGGLRGSLSDLPVPEILLHLGGSKATGVLTLITRGAKKTLLFKLGRLVFASSNLPNDRLGELLLREGKITVEDYETSVKSVSKGKRQGRALLESGALRPRDLWEGVQLQVREIAESVLGWDEGQFQFESSEAPDRERITVDLDAVELILAGIRRQDAEGRLAARFPEGDVVLERADVPLQLPPWEEHVRRLVDGERSVLEICRDSELGDSETLKVLYLLLAAGLARTKGRKVYTLDQDFVPEETVHSVLVSFNGMYGRIFQHMVKEVGPIAENVIEKYLSGLRETRKDVFAAVKLQKDGTLDGATLERNVNKFPEEERKARLVDALNELLYAELLAVKRTLGAEHEAEIIRALRAG